MSKPQHNHNSTTTWPQPGWVWHDYYYCCSHHPTPNTKSTFEEKKNWSKNFFLLKYFLGRKNFLGRNFFGKNFLAIFSCVCSSMNWIFTKWVGDKQTLSSCMSCMSLCNPVCTLTYLNNICKIFAQYRYYICTYFNYFMNSSM